MNKTGMVRFMKSEYATLKNYAVLQLKGNYKLHKLKHIYPCI